MKRTCLCILSLFQLVYGLSWAILAGGVILLCVRPRMAIVLTIMSAGYYIGAYVVLRGIVRLFGYALPAVPVPPNAVLIRRVILEEVMPQGSGPPVHRIVLEEVAPYYERNGHAR